MTNVLLAAKGPCVSSAFQALQIATSSVAEAVWCGSGVIVDGKTEWSGAEVADSLVCFFAVTYSKFGVETPVRRDRPDGLERALQRDPRSTRGCAAGVPDPRPGRWKSAGRHAGYSHAIR